MQRAQRSTHCRVVASAWLALLVALATAARADHPDPLPDQITLEGWSISYTEQNPYACMPSELVPPGSDRNFLPQAKAQELLWAVTGPVLTGTPGDPDGYLEGYASEGFLVPEGNAVPFRVYDCAENGVHFLNDCDSGSAPADEIRIPATRYCAAPEQGIRRVVGHELFHHVQFLYLNIEGWLAWGRTAFEGSARMMEDQVFSDLDAALNVGFMTDANDYLANSQQGFWSASYEAALGWKYAAEQYGLSTAEPGYGTDFVRTFWDNVRTSALMLEVDTPRVFEKTLQDFSATKRLQSWFQDFAIANAARQFDLSGLTSAQASLYSYVDENDGNGTAFAAPTLSASVVVPGAATGTVPVPWWATAYLRTTIADCNPGDILGFRGSDAGPLLGAIDGGDPMRFAALGISTSDGGGTQRVERVVRGGGGDFGAAFLVGGTSNISQIDAVLTATDSGRNVDFAFDCGPGAMTIGRPTTSYKAFVGPPGRDREVLGVVVRVTGPAAISTPTVKGLQREDFRVYVGTNNAIADAGVVLAAAELGESYSLTVLPPDKPGPNTYDLHVNLGSISATASQAVSYEDRVVHEVIALDRSASMIEPGSPGGALKIVAAQSAATQLVDWARSDGRLGVVAFDGNATTVWSLTNLSGNNRELIKNAIDGILISIQGTTSIGDAADRSADELVPDATSRSDEWIFLLTDGQENTALFWPQVEAAIQSAGIKVFAFGVGNDADHGALSIIRDATGGEYLPIDADGSAAAMLDGASGAGAGTDALPNALADAFLVAGETTEGLVRLWEVEGSLAQSATAIHPIVIEEGGIEEGTFTLHWNDAHDVLDVQVERPDRTLVTNGVAGARVYSDDTHIVFHAGDLAPGTWNVHVEATTGDPVYLGALSGRDRQGPRLEVEIAGLESDPAHAAAGIRHLWGIPQVIVGTLIGKAIVESATDADVTAEVEHPDGTFIALPLFDDGEHLDGAANDGVYGNAYPRTTSALPWGQTGASGSYTVVVTATGTNAQAEAFTRIRKKSFVVAELGDPPPDTDGDGMPDRYELRHHCLDRLVADVNLDPDLDTLTNGAEWRAGTEPCHPDTDRGGESDGSEALRAANPFDPADDALPVPIDPEVVDWKLEHIPFPDAVVLAPNANLIRYPVNAAYTTMEVLRATSDQGPFSVVATLSGSSLTGLYDDSGLANGTTYYYMVRPGDLNGNVGAPSRIFWGTPKADPTPPTGSVVIGDGGPYSETTTVVLSLVAPPDVTDVMISNSSTLAFAVWQSYAAHMSWTLAPTAVPGLATVYVKYRDSSGNESPTVYAASVTVVPAGSLAAVGGIVTAGGLADLSGILIRIPGQPTLPPTFSVTGGSFLMSHVPAGTYDFIVERTGYQSVVIESVVVPAGASLNLGTIVLLPLPTLPLLHGGGLALLAACTTLIGGRAISRARGRRLRRR